MNEIALLLLSSACVIYSIWQQTKVECLQERIAWRNTCIKEMENEIKALKKRIKTLSFALHGKQESEKNPGADHD